MDIYRAPLIFSVQLLSFLIEWERWALAPILANWSTFTNLFPSYSCSFYLHYFFCFFAFFYLAFLLFYLRCAHFFLIGFNMALRSLLYVLPFRASTVRSFITIQRPFEPIPAHMNIVPLMPGCCIVFTVIDSKICV